MSISDVLELVIDDEVWIGEALKDLQARQTERNMISFGLGDAVMDIGVSVRILLQDSDPARRYVSCATLIRSMFEMYVRSIWALQCATDDHIKILADPAKDDRSWSESLKIPASRFITDVEKTASHFGVLQHWRNAYWDAMCSYAHGGLRTIGRQIGDGAFEPSSSDEERKQVLKFAGMVSLLCCYAGVKFMDDQAAMKECLERFDRLAKAN